MDVDRSIRRLSVSSTVQLFWYPLIRRDNTFRSGGNIRHVSDDNCNGDRDVKPTDVCKQTKPSIETTNNRRAQNYLNT